MIKVSITYAASKKMGDGRGCTGSVDRKELAGCWPMTGMLADITVCEEG